MRATAEADARHTAQARVERRAKAWEVAKSTAAYLKEQYGVTRVVVFGSLIDDGRFHGQSDVDLAVWGLAAERYFEAVGRVLELGDEIELDLIMAERCKPSLAEAIEHGIEVT